MNHKTNILIIWVDCRSAVYLLLISTLLETGDFVNAVMRLLNVKVSVHYFRKKLGSLFSLMILVFISLRCLEPVEYKTHEKPGRKSDYFHSIHISAMKSRFKKSALPWKIYIYINKHLAGLLVFFNGKYFL